MKIPQIISTIITTICLIFGAVTVQAQTAPFEVEGPLTAVDPTGGTITVMGMTINVPAGTPISSPSAALADLDGLLGAALPGRGGVSGFLNGTAIVTGAIDDVTGALNADGVFSEPAENVILGKVTSVEGGVISVNGVATEELTDSRIPFTGYVNDFGTVIDKAGIQVGDLAALEGYYSATDAKMYIFLMEVEGVVTGVTPEVGITRAQGRDGQGKLEVRGGLTGISGTQTIELRDNANPNGPALASLVVTEDPVLPGTGIFRFRVDGLASVPTVVRVDNVTSPSFATFEVTIR